MLEKLKEHPKLVAAVIGVLILWWVMSSRGAATQSGNSGDMSTADMQYNLQVQAMQLNANQQSAHDAISLQALQLQNSGQYALAELAAHTNENANNLAAAIALEQINAQAQTAALVTTKQAEVANNQINAQVQQAAIASNTTIMTTQTVANALVAQSQISASVAQAAIENQCHGFGCLF